MIVDAFKRLFNSKTESSMERRAVESREEVRKREAEVEETHDIFDKTHRNLDTNLETLITEITGKKENHGK